MENDKLATRTEGKPGKVERSFPEWTVMVYGFCCLFGGFCLAKEWNWWAMFWATLVIVGSGLMKREKGN